MPHIPHHAHPGSQLEVLDLQLIGGFQATRAGSPVQDDAWQRRDGKRLVKLLATVPDHRLHREQIQECLWPNLAPESAAAALRKALHYARHAIEPNLPSRGASAYLHLHDDVVSLDGSSVRIDVDATQDIAEAALASGDPEVLERALAAAGGELLPEDRYEEWTTARRAALADLRLRLLLVLADVQWQTGQADAATERLRRVVELDPGREDVHRRLMRFYASRGQRHQALRQYQTCRAAVRRELDAPPDPETEAIYQAVLAGRTVLAGGTAPDPELRRPLPVAARRQASGMMVGRDQAFAAAMAALERTARGQGGALLVGGEAGVGKSRLVAEAARRAHERGALVLWGAATEYDGQLPYGALVQALDGALASWSIARRRELEARFPELVGLLPAASGAGITDDEAEAAPPDAGGVGARQTRLVAAVVVLLDELRAEHPLLLVLDDLHAADESTLTIFSALARLAGERPWLLVGTYRGGAVAGRGDLKELLTTTVRHGVAARLDLAPLTRAETDRLVTAHLPGGEVPAALRDDLFTRSQGNPFFVHELVQSMQDGGLLTLTDGRWLAAPEAGAAVPRQVRDLIEARVDRLGNDTRRTLALAATAGMECSFRLLRDAGVLEEPRLLDALDRALGADLLDERGDGYAFQHPLVRATLYESLSGQRRARLHAFLAEAIEQQTTRATPRRSAPVETLAHHWAAAGDPARAVPYIVKAAERAARVYANAEAIARLRQALLLRDELDDGADRFGPARWILWERLGDLHALAGESEPAQAAYAEAIGVADIDGLDGARLRRKRGQQALFAGDLAAADASLDAAEASLDVVPNVRAAGAERARLLAVRAQSDFMAFRFAESLAAGEASLRLAEEAGGPVDVARACEMVAMACLPLGEWRRGLQLERRSAALSDFNAIVRDASDVHLCLSEYHLYGDRPAEAARDFLRALGEAERIGAPRSLALCHYYLGNMAYFRGRFQDGLARLEEAIGRYRAIGSASGEAIALMMHGMTLTACGRLDEARQEMEYGLERASQGTLWSHALIRLYAGLGRNRLDANDAASARDYADRALALAEEPSDCICYAAVYPVATAAFALTGDLPGAAALGERALAQAHAIGTPPLLCMGQQANALVHALTGAWDEAFAALDEARQLAEEHSFPYELGRTLLMRSFVHLQRRSPRDLAAASALTAEAWPILLRLGVRASAAQARSSLGFIRGQLRRET